LRLNLFVVALFSHFLSLY